MQAATKHALRQRLALLALPVCILWQGQLVSAEAADSERAFTTSETRLFSVDDAIRFERFVNPHEYGQGTGIALLSPDGKHYLVRTRRGDLQSKKVVETLRIYQSVPSPCSRISTTANPIATLSLTTSSSRDVLHLKWANNETITFVEPDHRGTGQVYEFNSFTRTKNQITDSATDVLAYAIQDRNVVYYTRSTSDKHLVQLVNQQNLDQTLFPDKGVYRGYYQNVDLIKYNKDTRNTLKLSKRTILLPYYHQDIEISPDGRYAVTLIPSTDRPAAWTHYNKGLPSVFAFRDGERDSDPASLRLVSRPRYGLVDLVNGGVRPLLDAPLADLSLNQTPRRIFWTNDSQAVIVSSTWRPLGDARGADLEERASRPATVSVRIADGLVTPVFSEPIESELGRTSSRPERIVDILWSGDREELTILRGWSQGEPATQEVVRRQGDTWKISKPITQALIRANPQVVVKQELNQKPALVLKSGKCEQLILVPNSYLSKVSINEIEKISWTDTEGGTWNGGLLLPEDYESGRKYPLIVQTHGFDPSEFLVDGPYGTGTGLAARPLAAQGFAVLQIEDRSDIPLEQEPEAYAAGYKAGINAVVTAGIADPHRVGAIGFSATGLYLQEFVNRYPSSLSALILSDVGYYGYVSHVLGANSPATFLSQYDTSSQGPVPWDRLSSLGTWIDRNRFYKFADAAVPVRIEAITPTGLMFTWEVYAIRKRLGRPTDLAFYPDGEHSLYRPEERRASLEGSVDWFNFWLKNKTDPAESKREQYRHWEALRNKMCRTNDCGPASKPKER